MKVEVKKIDATQRELKFEIPRERVSRKLDEVYQEIGRTSRIKGYRPGKAPRPVLEAHHGRWAKEEAIKELIPETYQEGIAQEKITPVDSPEIQDVVFKEGSLFFTAKLDIKPEVRIKNYKGIYIKRKDSQITDEEVVKALEFLKKDGRESPVVLDDAFAKGLGYPSLEDLKISFKRQMEAERDRQNILNLENQIIEYLLKEASVAVPGSVISRQLKTRLGDAQRRMRSQGVPEEELKKREDQMRQELRPLAENDIKLFLILEQIAKLENITPVENENVFHKVMEFLLKEAQWNGGTT